MCVTICGNKQNVIKQVANVLSIQNVDLTGGGISIVGGTLVIGGNITQNITFTGLVDFSLGTHANKISKFETHTATHALMEYCGGSDIVSLKLSNAGAVITNNLSNAKGLIGVSDFSANYDDNTYIQKIYADTKIVSKSVTSLLQSPGAGQDNYRVVYEHSSGKFTLAAPVSTDFGSTDTQIIFNNAGTISGDASFTYDISVNKLTVGNIDLGPSTLGGTNRNISAIGTATDIAVTINPKAAGNVIIGLKTGALIIGDSTNNNTTRKLTVSGSQSQIDLYLEPKGTDGVVYIGNTAEAGAYRYLTASGNASNINLVLSSKGTGDIRLVSTTTYLGNTVTGGTSRQLFGLGSSGTINLSIGGKGANSILKIGNSGEAATYRYIEPDASGDCNLYITGKNSGANGKAFINGLASKTIQIGDWNMTAGSKGVAHGLGANFKKIRNISCIIRNDTDSLYYNLMQNNAGVSQGSIDTVDSSNITLRRTSSGTFDNTGFDSTSYNRGWVTIWYEA